MLSADNRERRSLKNRLLFSFFQDCGRMGDFQKNMEKNLLFIPEESEEEPDTPDDSCAFFAARSRVLWRREGQAIL